MQISSIIDIIDGKLQNLPSISFVYKIKTYAKNISQGDLFIAKNNADIALAIENGAFAVIYDCDVVITDQEIAWIKVDSFKQSLIKLFRFQLSSIDIKAFYCDLFTYELLYVYRNINKNIKLLPKDLQNSVNVIENINNGDILISCDRNAITKIYPDIFDLNEQDYLITNLTSHSLFESSFSYSHIYFSRLEIGSLYIQQFLSVFLLLSKKIDLLKLKKINILKPLFIDRFINIIDYGKSDKFILAQENYSLFKNEYEFITKFYKYAKTIYVTKKYEEYIEGEQYILNSIEDIKDILTNKEFNCVYMLGFNIEDIEKTLHKDDSKTTLFLEV